MAQKKNRKATPTSQPLNEVEEEGAFFGFDAHIIRNLVDNDGIAVSDWKEVDYLMFSGKLFLWKDTYILKMQDV